MLTYTPADPTLSPSEHAKAINKLRRDNPQKWYCYGTDVFSLKAFGTWVQRFETPAWTAGSPMDSSVKAYTAWLEKNIEAAYDQAAGR